jgi:hypothetical protein
MLMVVLVPLQEINLINTELVDPGASSKVDEDSLLCLPTLGCRMDNCVGCRSKFRLAARSHGMLGFIAAKTSMGLN